MFNNPSDDRKGITLLKLLFVLGVLAASVVSLCVPHCRERTQELTCDGVCVGAIATILRLRSPLLRRTYCKGRSLLCDGLLGGYLYGIGRAVIACL